MKIIEIFDDNGKILNDLLEEYILIKLKNLNIDE